MQYDLFICHAWEDKDSFVRPLAEALRTENVELWYDEFSLKLGDSIRRSIDKGLRQSRFGIVVLSKAFFEKEWPQYELDGLADREMRGKDKVILPIWHNVTHDEVMTFSPSLACRKAVLSAQGLDKIVSEILAVVRPQGSPLIIARDTLLKWGITPPVITDEFWLDIVEASNRVPGIGPVVPEESTWGRWSFPLPPKEGGPDQWGERLAWTAMQLNWVQKAEELSISPVTEPTAVLNFVDSTPGLFEICELYPSLVAEYAPQLTIPGMGGELEPTFEREYRRSLAQNMKVHKTNPKFGSALTTDEKSPSCDELWVLRHPAFGNYEPAYVANAYFAGGIFGPDVSPYEHADHLFWLLSSASSWLPPHIHHVLVEGMKTWTAWPWYDLKIDADKNWATHEALWEGVLDAVHGGEFRWTDAIQDDILHRIEYSIEVLDLLDSEDLLLRRFREHRFCERLIEEMKDRQQRQAKNQGKNSVDVQNP